MPMHALVPVGVVMIAAAAAWYPIPFRMTISFGDRCSVQWAVVLNGHDRGLFDSTFSRREGARFLYQLAIGGVIERIPASVRLCRSLLDCARDARVSARTGVGTGDAALTAILVGIGWIGSGVIAACCPEAVRRDIDIRGDFSRAGIGTVIEFTGRVRVAEVILSYIIS